MNHKILYGILILVLAFLAWYFHTIIAYIIISGVISLIIQPLHRLLLKVKIGRFKIPEALSAFASLMALYFSAAGVLSLFLPLVTTEAKRLAQLDLDQVVTMVRGPIDSLQAYINSLHLGDVNIQAEAKNALAGVADVSQIGNSLNYIFGVTGDVFMALFAITFISFFFIKDEGLLYNIIMAPIPEKYMTKVSSAMSQSKKLLTRYFIGVIIEVAIIITIVSVGLAILGVENAILIGFLAGLFNVIPYVGPMIGALLGIIIGITTNVEVWDMTVLGLMGKMALVYAVAQVLDNVVLQPLIYSQSVKAHPLEVFLVIIMAGNVAGIVGMIVAIPAYSIFRVFIREFLNEFKVVKELTGDMD
ncbi:MAG: putative PurR-regulated permease PerM [Oceanospirillaceae bacterium]|jgi:predicted PurR-regulated permease PerM